MDSQLPLLQALYNVAAASLISAFFSLAGRFVCNITQPPKRNKQPFQIKLRTLVIDCCKVASYFPPIFYCPPCLLDLCLIVIVTSLSALWNPNFPETSPVIEDLIFSQSNLLLFLPQTLLFLSYAFHHGHTLSKTVLSR